MDNAQQVLTLSSPAFCEGGTIPLKHTGYGEDCSPVLHLSGISKDAKCLAIIMDDCDHPVRGYNHWVIWNLPVMEEIPESIPHGEQVPKLGGAVQGVGYGKHRYRGPKPPFGWSHRYRFTVYALNCMLELPVNTRKKALAAAMEGKVLQTAQLIGSFR